MGPQESTADRHFDWEAFLKQCEPVARELYRDSSAAGQEAYLHWIASMIVRARAAEIPRAKVGRFGTLEPRVSFGVGYRGKPFFVGFSFLDIATTPNETERRLFEAAWKGQSV